MTMMLDVRIVNDGETFPFPEGAAVAPATVDAHLDRAAVVEKLGPHDKAGVVLLAKLDDGRTVRLVATANIIDMLAGAVRGACMKWGQWK